MRFRACLVLAFIGFSCLLLTGCGAALHTEAIALPANMKGAVHGGQQPVAGATIQLYAVGTVSTGSPSAPLISAAVLTDSNGSFNITGDYTCPSASSLVYLVATGGQPTINVANPQLAMMAALGSCGDLAPTSFVQINEVTTVAAVYQFAPFMTSFSAIGSSSGDAPVLANAFNLASQLVNVSTGSAPGTNVPSSITVPIAQVNTIADIVAACINSAGGQSGDNSVCGNFFAWTTPAGGTTATDTIGALTNLANNPALNTSSLFSLISSSPPFQPSDSPQPSSLAIPFGLLEIVNNSADFTNAISGLNSAKTGGTVVVEPNTAVTLTSLLTISAPMTFICEPGSSITAAVAGNLISVTGSNVTVQNCTMTDVGEPANSSLFVVKAPYFSLQNSTLKDTNSNSSALAINSPSANFNLSNNIISGQIHMQGATQGIIFHNTVNGLVYGEDNTTYITANQNTIAVTSGSALAFHGTSPGNTVNHITMIGNHLTQGGVYCIEVGAFGTGTIPPTDVVASDNTCDLTAGNTGGGYSFDTTIGTIVSNNVFNADGYTIRIAAIEIVSSYDAGKPGPTGPGSGAIVTGNTMNGGGLTLNKQSNNVFDSNIMNMNPNSGGIFVGGVYGHSDNNVISNNTLSCPACVSNPNHYKFIWLQNNPTDPATLTGTQITGNTFAGNNSGEFAIWLENDDKSSATQMSDFDNTTISGNTFVNITNDIHPQTDTENIYLMNNTCGANNTWLYSPLPANIVLHGETSTCTTRK